MSLKVEYKCATCGMKHEIQGEGLHPVVKREELWHMCADRNIVQLQWEIIEVKDVPKQKTGHK